VLAAAADGRLDPARLASYRKLRRELAHQARRSDARLRQAEQRRWKQIHRALRAHPKPRD
jgi:ribosome biogenesis GTPase